MRVLIGMSGGVDSTVAAYLMQQAGYSCEGATMELCSAALGCGGSAGTEDAQKAARKLGIPFHVLDGKKPFQQQVVDAFVNAYETGLTPNPCILCNCHLKFSYMLEEAKALGCELVATGHYARIQKDGDRYLLYKATDTAKDQSYFLAGLTQQQLARTQFPLGELTKEQVRQIAREQGFENAKKQDSQDICFIPDGDYKAFLERYTGKSYPAGNYLDLEGNVIGTHSGSVGYTIGQRKGLGIGGMSEPVYVCSKDTENNTVTVGPNSALFRDTLDADHWNWIAFPCPTEPFRANAKLRSRHTEQPATIYPLDNGTARVVFDEPQRAITPGQTVVLYDGDLVLASGTIK